MRESRKLQLIILMVLVCLVGTLSIAYAVLSTTLQINGNAEVSSASWDIYLDNPQVVGGSVTIGTPIITDKTTATFSTTLSKPGDYYMFTVDVVNNGTIDAMIDGIIKSPTLTEAQAKYFSYVVEYQNGESITTKQLVAKKSFVRLKVKVEFRKDITASDLPTQSETLSLSFKVNYVQSDENSENITIDNNGKLVKVVSGNYDTVGSEICIGNECFYVISSDEDSVTMLAKYNLYVGNEVYVENGEMVISPLEYSIVMQDSTALGAVYYEDGSQKFPWIGTVEFSTTPYWINLENNQLNIGYPIDNYGYAYVYSQNSTIYPYIQQYKLYLEELGAVISDARLLKINEAFDLGCENGDCSNVYDWLSTTSYWLGNASRDLMYIFRIYSYQNISDYLYNGYTGAGVRPVIEMSLSYF